MVRLNAPHNAKRQMPKVSICLPNLNTRPYLVERMETILSQTFTDWELIIVDDYSTDGAWELFQEYAAADSRIKLYRGPQQGLYPGWNSAIERCIGEYVYFATSDDTMAPNCLERLLAALSNQPTCDLAHCSLKTIDETGQEIDLDWYKTAPFLTSAGPLRDEMHLRMAPFDGLLHLLGQSVYCSMTQLLIRRSLFERIGVFESTWGPMGDFHWNMRASLVSNTVHVPDTWGGWRVHKSQASTCISMKEYYVRINAMTDHALLQSLARLPKPLRNKAVSWGSYFRDKKKWLKSRSSYSNFRMLASSVLLNRLIARHYLAYRLGVGHAWKLSPVEIVESWTRSCGIRQPMIKLSSDNSQVRL